MATRNAHTNKANPKAGAMTPPNDGWKTLTHDIDGWFVAEEGQTIEGRIVGTTIVKSIKGNQLAYLVQVASETVAFNSESKENEPFPPGSVIALRESFKLTALREYVEHNGEVRIKVGKKKTLGQGRSLVNYHVQVRGRKSEFLMPSMAPIASVEPPSDGDDGGEDVPW